MTRVIKADTASLGKAISANSERQAQALKRAAIRTLTRAAGIAQDTFIAEEKSTFRAPVDFTTNPRGFRITPARKTDDPQSKFGIKPKQASFLKFAIDGGERQPGDAGTSTNYVWKPTKGSRKTAAGSLVRYFTKQTRAEAKLKRPIRGGGVFFGKLPGHDDTGYILRPARTFALYKHNAKGEMVLARPHDRRRVSNVNRAQMLVQADKSSSHRPIIPYLEIMRAAMGTAATEMGRRLQEELRK